MWFHPQLQVCPGVHGQGGYLRAPFHGGCQVAVTLPKSRTMVQKAKGQGKHISCLGLGPLHGVNLRSGAVEQGERDVWGTHLLL